MPFIRHSRPAPETARRRSRPAKAQGAFTLIELLVVIAIISILASILFPAFASAREKARQTACLSNTKQLGEAFLMYSQDFDEGFPGSGSYVTSSGNIPLCGGKPDDGWVRAEYIDTTVNKTCTQAQLPVPNGALYTYVKNQRVYICPSDLGGDDRTLSYAMNSRLSDQAVAYVREPSSCILLADQQNGRSVVSGENTAVYLDDGNLSAPGTDLPNGNANFAGMNDQPANRHLNGGVIAYVDGHSKWARPSQLKAENFDPLTDN